MWSTSDSSGHLLQPFWEGCKICIRIHINVGLRPHNLLRSQSRANSLSLSFRQESPINSNDSIDVSINYPRHMSVVLQHNCVKINMSLTYKALNMWYRSYSTANLRWEIHWKQVLEHQIHCKQVLEAARFTGSKCLKPPNSLEASAWSHQIHWKQVPEATKFTGSKCLKPPNSRSSKNNFIELDTGSEVATEVDEPAILFST